MKILKLTFENINSYEGKVEIDFTNPDFQKGNNQFVICGPMGSGKSTILDAITLALFGSTARLGRLTTTRSDDKSNELINKHSGHCRSEVCYSCSKGVFESVFELRKARDKANGNVQKPQCAFFEIVNGEKTKSLLDSATTDSLQKKNEEVIGLNYEQFIRCILIPQGEFDKFLTSDDRDKAAILAKLSHTEHFKKVAEFLNNIASQINMDYKGLKEKRDGIEFMGEEERKAGEEEKEALKEMVLNQENLIKELDIKINWMRQLLDAEKEYLDTKTELDKVNAGREEYEKRNGELKNAKKAADCELEYQNLKKCVEDQKKEQDAKSIAENKLTVQNNKKIEAENVSREKSCELELKKKEKEKQKELWNKVRDLDKKISVTEATRNEKKEASNKTKMAFDVKQKKYIEDEEKVKSYKEQIVVLKEYLDKNISDTNLEVTIAMFTEKRRLWKTAVKNYEISAEQEKKCNRKIKQLQEENADLVKEREDISFKLRNLVNSKYLLVAGILRRDLQSGQICPVCGKRFNSENDVEKQEFHTHSNAAVDEEQEQVATDISKMHDKLEEIDGLINDKEKEISGSENDLKNIRNTKDQAQKEIDAILVEFNGLLKDWDIHVAEDVSEKELSDLELSLNEKNNAYKDKRNQQDLIVKEIEAVESEMKGIDLKKLQEDNDEAVSAFNVADGKYNELINERKALFGEKVVDEVEKVFDDALMDIEKEKVDAENNLNSIKGEVIKIQAKIEEYAGRINELKEQQKNFEVEFSDKIEKNQFSSEEDFLTCRRTKDVIDDLGKSIKEYETKKTEADTSYRNAKAKYENLLNRPITDETVEALNAQKKALEGSKKENSEKIGGLEEKLKQDDKNKKAWKAADNELKKLGEEAIIYSRINEMLGKKDGSDFEVFVQGIAMRSLLEKANTYLSSIISRYRLVQKKENSIDFLVIETMGDLTEIKRDLKNFSGGEKFIISLSLALAMAEFAGQNGDVECIFLDEGFGTLSGDPLIDAINALKKLSSTGKMLGIITHIDAVIQAFNRIEAVKVGEKSILKGPGVTYTNANKK